MLSIKKEQFKTSQDFFRKLDLLHSLLLFTPLALFVVLYLSDRYKYATRYRDVWLSSHLENWHVIIMTIIPALLLMFYYKLKKKDVALLLASDQSLKDKMVFYYRMHVKYFLLLLFTFLLVLGIQYYILNQIYSLAFAVVLIVASVEKPTSLRMCKLMKLDKKITEMVYTQKEIIE